MAEPITVILEREWPGEEPEELRSVLVDRHVLVKRRWRVRISADLELVYASSAATKHLGLWLGSDGHCYQVRQGEEEVVTIPMPSSHGMAAKLGWYLGNQHLAVEVREKEIVLESVHTLTRSLDRIGIPYQIKNEVFLCALHSSHTH